MLLIKAGPTWDQYPYCQVQQWFTTLNFSSMMLGLSWFERAAWGREETPLQQTQLRSTHPLSPPAFALSLLTVPPPPSRKEGDRKGGLSRPTQ